MELYEAKKRRKTENYVHISTAAISDKKTKSDKNIQTVIYIRTERQAKEKKLDFVCKLC